MAIDPQTVRGYDPEGNPRTHPVRVNGDIIVWHSQQEYDALWAPADDKIVDWLTPPGARPPRISRS